MLMCDRDNRPGGVPIPFIRRRILEQHTLAGAVDVVKETPKSFSTNLMLSHTDGECINLETVPGSTFVVCPENGLLVHANHFESAEATARVEDKGVALLPCSPRRKRRVVDALVPHLGELSLDHFKKALGDKSGDPDGVCAYPAEDTDGTVHSTVATILMDVALGHMQIAVRPYAEHVYVRYDLVAP